MINWEPIEKAPKNIPIIVYREGYVPAIAEFDEEYCEGGCWVEYLMGDYYGTVVTFEPTHFATW